MLRRARPEDADALARHPPRGDARSHAVAARAAHARGRSSLPPRRSSCRRRRSGSPRATASSSGFTALGTRGGDEFMEHLYVAPEHQRRGIGTELMERAKERRPAGSGSGCSSETSARATSTSATGSGSSSSRTDRGTRRRSRTRSTNGPAQARNPRVRIPCARRSLKASASRPRVRDSQPSVGAVSYGLLA